MHAGRGGVKGDSDRFGVAHDRVGDRFGDWGVDRVGEGSSVSHS